MSYLSTVDYVIVGVYLAVLLGMGIVLSSKASQSLDDYFLGGRRMPWWALGISGMASNLDVTGTMLIVSFLYMLGPRGLFIEFRGGAVLILAVMLLWTGKWNRRSGCMTGAEWMEYRFGKGIGGQAARIVTSISITVGMIGSLGYMTKGMGLFLSTFLPFSPFVCAVIMVSVATIYTMMSGFYGVVYTDMFQALIILGAVIGITALAINSVDVTPGTLDEIAQRATGTAHWSSAAPAVHVDMPRGYEPYNMLMMFALFYILKNILLAMGMGQDSKYYGARNERECGTLTFLWTGVMTMRWPMMISFAVLGLVLVQNHFSDHRVLSEASIAIKQHVLAQEAPDQRVDFAAIETAQEIVPLSQWTPLVERLRENPSRYPEHATRFEAAFGPDWSARLGAVVAQQKLVEDAIPVSRWHDVLARISAKSQPQLAAQLTQLLGDKWQQKLKLLSYEGTIDPERILPVVLLWDIPVGFRGLILIALLAASMSTFDTGINMAAAYFTRDLYQRYWRPRAKNFELMAMTYVFIVVMVGGGLIMGYTSGSINEIWAWLTMGLGAGAIAPGLLKFYWWRFNATGVITGTVFGMGAAVADRLFPQIVAFVHTLFPATFPSELVSFIYILVIGAVGSVIGTFASRASLPETLQDFYESTRPFGLWGPLKRKLPHDVQRRITREHFNDLAALPFTLGWQITMFMLAMLLVIRNWTAFWPTLGLFLACLGGMWFFWYRNLPPASAGVIDSIPKLMALDAQRSGKTVPEEDSGGQA